MRLVDAEFEEKHYLSMVDNPTPDVSKNDRLHALAIARAFRMAPTVEERKKGRWKVLDGCSNEGIYCSECHKKVFKIDYSNTMKWKNFRFCPNCGSAMKG